MMMSEYQTDGVLVVHPVRGPILNLGCEETADIVAERLNDAFDEGQASHARLVAAAREALSLWDDDRIMPAGDRQAHTLVVMSSLRSALAEVEGA
jgi:hypothetical protein